MNNQEQRQRIWQTHLEQWQASGLSGAAYCQQQQLTYHCFAYWRRKLMPDMPSTGESPFVKVTESSASSSIGMTSSLQLTLPNGLVIQNIQLGNLKLVRALLEQL